jgi:hypothetical protein
VRPYLEKKNHKKGLVEWLKVQALNSSPSTAEKTERKEGRKEERKEERKKLGW